MRDKDAYGHPAGSGRGLSATGGPRDSSPSGERPPRASDVAASRAQTRTVLRVVSASSWAAIDELRTFVASYCVRHLTRGADERANMACQELLECALRCSAANGELEFELTATPKPTSRFEVRVGTEMVQARQDLLRQRIKWVQDCRSDEAYRSAVDAMASGTGDEQTLALARLRSEDISLSLSARGTVVTLIARGAS